MKKTRILILIEEEFIDLYHNNNIEITNHFRLSVDLNMNEYLEHAKQNKETRVKIQELLKKGLNDKKLSDFLFLQNGEMYFKRPVYLIIGRK